MGGGGGLNRVGKSSLITFKLYMTNYRVQTDFTHFRSTRGWWNPCAGVLEDSDTEPVQELVPFYFKDLTDCG